MTGALAVNNAEYQWDLFDSESYQQSNYATLHELDQIMIPLLAQFFDKRELPEHARAIDVGPGANLYPAMAMLPFAETITLWEYSSANVDWLRQEISGYRPSWDDFWQALVRSCDRYRDIRPAELLPRVVEIEKGSIFDLEEGRWDLGTMFFVAESITGMLEECAAATVKFVRSLRPGAPFVATFMEGSRGYVVGDQTFPAVEVTAQDVLGILRGVASDVTLYPVQSPQLFRHGYDGMMLVTGVRSGTADQRVRHGSGSGTNQRKEWSA
ncbi:SCO2525 family SAM-dependent methyltransferase [Catellatospora sp. KI3]|uniref:SCO2525 family SAM-dependent methyltransferase n=1 Tax=Catellatospora sp. KI3 TaxID=3041620 RepID=UPI002482D1BB|nr:SCO2525 family SAM-dependent methyltransferase [Catellatospora sp. KI3]MDI1465184.1 SCO2525 family SAM-dependent methyltransferase [Catellatospora sp. KI3]